MVHRALFCKLQRSRLILGRAAAPDFFCHRRACELARGANEAQLSGAMRQSLTHILVSTRGQGLVEVTGEIARWAREQNIATGLLTIFCQHTSASLLIQENADPDVRSDLLSFFRKLAPEGRGLYVHEDEGADDMPAHIRAALTQTQLSIPIENRRMLLGTWQGVYLFEHRAAPHERKLVLYLIGEG
jgi:secondary thiamine-phosphate synthase enzyme